MSTDYFVPFIRRIARAETRSINIVLFKNNNRHYDITYKDFTCNDFTYNNFAYNDFTFNESTYNALTYYDFIYNINKCDITFIIFIYYHK